MAVSTDVFDLINTLSASEKRYFRLFCGLQGGEKNYLRLFDFLAEAESYDEEAVKTAFKGETFAKSLHVTKNYLYNLVLKCLRSYHAQNHIDQKMGDLIADILLLEDRGLYHLARQSLNKAKKLARKYHRYYYLIFLLRKEATYYFAIDDKNTQANIDQLNKELQTIGEILMDENDAYELYYRSAQLTRGRFNSEPFLSDLKDRFEIYRRQPIDPESRSFFANYLGESVRSAILFEEGNVEERYESTKKVVDLWRANRHMIESEPHLYKIQLANFLHASFQAGYYNRFPETLNELSNLPSRNFNEEAETFQNTSFYWLLYYLNTKELNTARESLEWIIEGLEKYQSKINKARELSFYYNISILYFMLDDIKVASDWLDKILNHAKTDHRKDIQRFAELFQLFYLYNSLDHFELLESRLVSVRKKINRWQSLSDFEKVLLDGVKALINASSKKEKILELENMKSEIAQIREQSPGTIQMGDEEVLIWVDRELSKLQQG